MRGGRVNDPWPASAGRIGAGSKNLQSTGFAPDYHMTSGARHSPGWQDPAMRVKTLADHGTFNAAAQFTSFPAGLFSIWPEPMGYPTAFARSTAFTPARALACFACRCRSGPTEAAYLIEKAKSMFWPRN